MGSCADSTTVWLFGAVAPQTRSYSPASKPEVVSLNPSVLLNISSPAFPPEQLFSSLSGFQSDGCL